MSTTPSQILLLFSFCSNSKPDYFSPTALEKNEMTIFEEAASNSFTPFSSHPGNVKCKSILCASADTETAGSPVNAIPELELPILDMRWVLILRWAPRDLTEIKRRKKKTKKPPSAFTPIKLVQTMAWDLPSLTEAHQGPISCLWGN